jgi:D-3-phosphoglycerate dehydrogenase / 2-oxoglutarate reductase
VRMRIAFFEKWADPIAEATLGREPGIELLSMGLSDPPERVRRTLARAHGYQWPRPPYLGTRELIANCPHMLAMAAQGSGTDMMDHEACTEAGILVLNQRGLGPDAVAEHAVGLMLAVSRRIVQADRRLHRDRDWTRGELVGADLNGRTVGIIGYGFIGRRLADICRGGFAMRVLAFDPHVAGEEMRARGDVAAELDMLLREADFVAVTCPLNEETRGLIGLEQFRRMKPGAFFVTTARGGIHDEEALLRALEEGVIAGAGLDVWQVEPPPLDHPLLARDDVVATPHIAGHSRDALRRQAEGAIEQWLALCRGQRPPRLCNPEAWPRFLERFERVTGAPFSAERRSRAAG